MKLEFNLDWEIAAQVAGYAWAINQPLNAVLDAEESYNAHYRQFIAGTELEEDPPTEANRAMSFEAWRRGVDHAENLLRIDAFISTSEAADRARCNVSYIKAEIKRGNLKAQKVGKGLTSAYMIHARDFKQWSTRRTFSEQAKRILAQAIKEGRIELNGINISDIDECVDAGYLTLLSSKFYRPTPDGEQALR